MNRDYDYSVLSSSQEAVQCSQIMAQSFIASPEEELNYLHQVGFDHVRVVRQDGEIVGGLALLPMGQWFGGRRLAMTGVASVAISPHSRGQGAATALMSSAVKEMAANGTTVSVLYPAVQSLYQKAGYGLGGSRYLWRIPAEQIQVRQQPWPCYPLPTQALDARWPALQQSLGPASAGRLDRHPLIWQRLLTPPGDGAVFAYGVGSDQSLQGYVIVYQERGAQGTILTIRDWAATSLDAMQSIWSLIYQQRAQIDIVQWAGGAVDPLALALPEQRAEGLAQAHWMMRILSVEQALTQRGYPTGIQAEVHLDIVDALIPSNNGKFILSINDGTGQLTPGGRGDLAIDIQHLASLFTRLRAAPELSSLGLLQASPTDISRATVIFAGPSPWMADFF